MILDRMLVDGGGTATSSTPPSSTPPTPSASKSATPSKAKTASSTPASFSAKTDAKPASSSDNKIKSAATAAKAAASAAKPASTDNVDPGKSTEDTAPSSVAKPTASGAKAAPKPQDAVNANLNGARFAEVQALTQQASAAKKVYASLSSGSSAGSSAAKTAKSNLDSLNQQLENAKTLNFLADAAYANNTSMSQNAALNIENGNIKATTDSSLASDAEYDSDTDTVYVNQKILDAVHKQMVGLEKQGVVDSSTGAVLNGQALVNSSAHHNLVVTQALLGVHEFVHATQHDDGQAAVAQDKIAQSVDASAPQLQELNSEQDKLTKSTAGLDQAAKQLLSPALKAIGNQKNTIKHSIVAADVSNVEYDAYHAQELFQYQNGEAPQKNGWLTIDNNGNSLPRATAIANILKLQGSELNTQLADQAIDSYAFAEPGVRNPGVRNPGVRNPGVRNPGVRNPGVRNPGVRNPGVRNPGVRNPGEVDPGVRNPGVRNPGVRNPGEVDPGVRNPGVRNPGVRNPGVRNPGVRNPGVRNPGEADS